MVVYRKFCVPLMLISNNVYTFISGILLSLSTGIFTTLCIEKITFFSGWNLYLATVLYLVAGALCIYIATKISSYQNYITMNKIINIEDKKSIINDFEASKGRVWFATFGMLFVSLIAGTGLLIMNFYLK